MLVYRLEAKGKKHKKDFLRDYINQGPYQGGANLIEGNFECDGGILDGSGGFVNDTHPTPTQDMKLSRVWFGVDDRQFYVFGFENTDSLVRWFGEMKNHQIDNLYEINVYEADEEYDVMIGTFQVAFKACNSKLVQTLLPSSLK